MLLTEKNTEPAVAPEGAGEFSDHVPNVIAGRASGIAIATALLLAGGVSTEAMALISGCTGATEPYCQVYGENVTLPDGAHITSTTVPWPVYARTGGSITGTGIIIESTSGGNSSAVAVNEGSQVTLTGGSITSHGDSNHGVMTITDNAGTITLNSLSVTTLGTGAFGLWASGSASTINATDVTVTTSGGIVAGGGGPPPLSAYGAQVGSHGRLTFTGGSINTTGDAAIGVYVNNAGSFTLAGGSITTGDPTDSSKGGAAHGLYLVDPGSSITAKADPQGNPFSITTYGAGAHAAYVSGQYGPTPMLLSDGVVSTYGANAHGLFIDQYPSTLTATSVDVWTYGANSYGAAATDGANISITDSFVTSAQSAALYMANGQSRGGTATIDNTKLDGITGIQVNSTGFTTTINATRGSQIIGNGGNGDALNVTRAGGGTVVLNADATTILGDMVDTQPSGQTNVTLTNNSNFTGGTTALYDLSLSSSRWNVTRTSDFRNELTNRGIINFQPPVGDPQQLGSYKTIKVTSGASGSGNYTTGGGEMHFNSFLGAGSFSDLLAVNSVTLSGGPTRVFVKDSDPINSGGLTTGDGIELVDVTGQSPAGAFTLGHRVAAGGYDYSLYQGGVTDTTNGNWYLRVSGAPPPAPPCTGLHCRLPPPPPPPPPCFGPHCRLPPPPRPPRPAPAPNPTPPFRVEVPLYWSIPSLAQEMGLTLLGNMHDRIGDRIDENGEPSTGWARGFGRTGKTKSADFMTEGPSYDYGIAGFQAGLDLYRYQRANGASGRVGFSFGAANGEADVKHIFGGPAGSLNIDAYQLGGYWTHFGPKGWYLDAVVQATWYQDISARSFRGESTGTDGWGGLASLEGGYPLRFGDGWSLEPQAQLIYQRVSIGEMADRYALVRYGDTDQWHGRLGARLVKTSSMGNGRTLTGWGRVNLWHDFASGSDMTISNLYGRNAFRLLTERAKTWAQFELGVTGQLSEKAFLFASGDYKVAVQGPIAHSFGGRIGFKYAW